MKRVLIVGGAGFIGNHIAEDLKKTDCRLRILDLKNGEDVRDGIEERWDCIIFLAASIGRTQADYSYNKELYVALDEYMQRYPNTHVIFSSSASVYADSLYPHRENDATQPPNLYGASKLHGEAFVNQYRRRTIFRFSNVTGDNCNGLIGALREGSNQIFGDGQQVRDYVQVSVVAACVDSAVFDPERWSGTINLSSGIGSKTIDIFIQYGSGEPVFIEERIGDVHCSILNNSRMTRLLNES